MARFRGGQGRAIALAALLVLGFLFVPAEAADDLYYDRPVLTVDPGMHTALINAASADAAGRFAVTGSEDKTVRVWSLSDGKLVRTIRVPAGPGAVGKIYAVAMSPDSNIVAAGGLLGKSENELIYLFDRETGHMIKRIAGLDDAVFRLVFSPDGQYLAATLSGPNGVRVFDRDKDWSEVFNDSTYAADTYGAAFARDGHLATASYDGKIRLYDNNFRLIGTPLSVPNGYRPNSVAFNPTHSVLAVGYDDAAAVDLFDSRSLSQLPGPDLDGLALGTLEQVAWSSDGQTLYASGDYPDSGDVSILSWDGAGRGKRLSRLACRDNADTALSIVTLPEQKLLVTTANPCLTLFDGDDHIVWTHSSPKADFRQQQSSFAVSSDGMVVDFGFEMFGKSRLRFDVRTLRLSSDPNSDHITRPPIQHIPEKVAESFRLEPFERVFSTAAGPQAQYFLWGTSWHLRAFTSNGDALWDFEAPEAVFAINVSGDEHLVVAAYGDGTIRWHHPADGRELLALQVLPDKKNWVLWTPEGFYAATPGAHGVLRWLVNRGPDKAADTVPVSAIPKLNRSDALPLVLQERETARALGIADLAAARIDVQSVTGAAEAPGARLHVLAIGIREYGDKAEALRLKFADKDAEDVANALLDTQGGQSNKLGGLYAQIVPQYLPNDQATRENIFTALDTMQRRMATSPSGQDMAVVMFSGHGAMIDGRLFLLPYGVNARTAASIKGSAIAADEFQQEIKKLAEHGHVLVLLDACHSGAAAADGTGFAPNADLLRSAMASGNISVLTSSSAAEVSRENDDWKNGAFTKVLIEALGKDADENHDGMISMSELTAYIARRLPGLTGDKQHPGIEQRFQSNLFAAGL